jgi:hypothetical protein
MTTTVRHACGCRTTTDHDTGGFEQVTCPAHIATKVRANLRITPPPPKHSPALIERIKRLLRPYLPGG